MRAAIAATNCQPKVGPRRRRGLTLEMTRHYDPFTLRDPRASGPAVSSPCREAWVMRTITAIPQAPQGTAHHDRYVTQPRRATDDPSRYAASEFSRGFQPAERKHKTKTPPSPFGSGDPRQ